MHRTRYRTPPAAHCSEQGFALITVLLVVIIVSMMSSSMFDMTEEAQQVSSSSIQRDRVFQSIDTALASAEQYLSKKTKRRVFADANATEGVYKRGSRADRWWKGDMPVGEMKVDEQLVLGVVSPPAFIAEEIGSYVADGGTGIVNLGSGSGAYGSAGDGAREIVLYSLQAYGRGTYEHVQAAAESTIVFNR